MRLRFWLGLAAVLLIAAGSVAAALIVHVDDNADFDASSATRRCARRTRRRRWRRSRSGSWPAPPPSSRPRATSPSTSSTSSPTRCCAQGALSGTAFVAARARLASAPPSNARHGAPILERGADGPAPRPPRGRTTTRSSTPSAARRHARAGRLRPRQPTPNGRRSCAAPATAARPVATPPVPLLVGGTGINVYRPVYRDGAPTATVAQRRAALIGFAAGAFRVNDLAAAAISTAAGRGRRAAADRRRARSSGRRASSDDRAPRADPHRRPHLAAGRPRPQPPDVSLPLLLAVVGISLAALLGALILVWSRNERMQELQREASQDSLTGLKNRRRFEEDLRMAMARGRREGTTGAVLMLDLDHFKQVNDTLRPPGRRPPDRGDRRRAAPAHPRERRPGAARRRRVRGRPAPLQPGRGRVVAEAIAPRSASTGPPTPTSSRSPPASAWRCSATTRASASSR